MVCFAGGEKVKISKRTRKAVKALAENEVATKEIAQKYLEFGEYEDKIKKYTLNKILIIISEIPNPYPRDIFSWDNKSELEFSRGQFHSFIFDVVETTKENIKRKLKEDFNRQEI